MAVDALTPADRATLAPALGEDAEAIAADVAAGHARVARYLDGSRIVLRLERDTLGRAELVIVAGAGEGCREKVAALVEQARRHGWTLRAHATRPGIARMFEGLGFHETERVMRHG